MSLEKMSASKSFIDLKTKDSVTKELKLSNIQLIEKIELPLKNPVWYPISVKSGQRISIKAIVEYLNINYTDNRKAVLLIRTYNDAGEEVNVSFDKMARSDNFEAHFKYLSSTQDIVEELYTFIVPEGVSIIHFGFSRFLCSEDERVVVNDLTIYPEEKIEVSKLSELFLIPNEHSIGKVELPLKDPIWYLSSVKPGHSLSIKAIVEYSNIKTASKRKALLLVKCYDETDEEVNGHFNNLSWSENFEAHFKYLPPTRGVVDNLYTLLVPENVATVHVGFVRFLCSADEKVILNELSLSSSIVEDNENLGIVENELDIEDSEEEYKVAFSEFEDIYSALIEFDKNNSFLSKDDKAHKLILASKTIDTESRYIVAGIAANLCQDAFTLMSYAWECVYSKNYYKAIEVLDHLQVNELANEKQLRSLKGSLSSRLSDRDIKAYSKQSTEGNPVTTGTNTNSNKENESGLNIKYDEEQVAVILDKSGAEEVIELLDNEIFSNKIKATYALKAANAVRNYKDSRPEDFKHDTDLLASYAYALDKSESTLRNVYFAYQRTFQYDKLEEVTTLLRMITGDNPTPRQRKLLWSTPEHLITLADQVPDRRQALAYEPTEGKICYVIHNSLPYSSGGYATRGHGLLTALNAQGLDIYAMTRPGYPHDISDIKVEEVLPADRIDDVIYKRLLSPSRRDYSNYEYILKAVESYKQAFEVDRPALIIAASNHLDGLPAMFAARDLGIPFIYEIRGFWEITRLSKHPEFEQDPMFEVEKRLEAVVAEHADHIFTLTQGMVDELESRGVQTQYRITLLPNSCNVERFNPIPKDTELAAELNIPLDVPVIGYVGTLVSYEGLDDLAMACSKLKQLGYEFRLLIVGNEDATGQSKGSIVQQIEQIAEETEFKDWLIMPGRIPFEEVESYYSLIDIAPFPRKAWPVCEIVPPMKTLEALSMKKAVVVSSNKALTEMITHDVNGRIFERGNVEDLVEQLQYLLDHPEKWSGYGEAGRIFVENERTWQRTAEKAVAVIEKVLNQ
ncbi:glycosyltransferase family 4 protein [uncultured Psychrobacter sp.]|uniref:glycosyltransferase family 4 protein n=1 Tax=uncultured Psychrobacter sp. TaxID=259303 RepID=UPI003459D1AC